MPNMQKSLSGRSARPRGVRREITVAVILTLCALGFTVTTLMSGWRPHHVTAEGRGQ
jgi:hypothetical protein